MPKNDFSLDFGLDNSWGEYKQVKLLILDLH